ncbi:SDR family oxidoreductase [Rhodococcus sp. NPDC003994]
MILITGAGGSVGRSLLRGLHERGIASRAFVKNADQGRVALSDGATEIVVGDVRSRDDIVAAADGVTRIYHANPTSIVREVFIAEYIVEAARKHGVEHVVYHSVIHPDIAEMFHHQEKGRVETVFEDSGIPSTFLRASHFMQNYLDFWEFVRGGALPYPTSPNSVMGVVDAEDVGEVSARILAAPVEKHAGGVYDLSTQELTRHEMAAEWSAVLGHKVSAVKFSPNVVTNPLWSVASLGALVGTTLPNNPVAAPLQIVRGARQSSNAKGVRNWPRESQDCYVRMMQYYDKNGLPAGDLTVLPELLERPATSYREFARREARRRGHVTTD